jgi:alanine-synthesizing transaminase
VFSRRLNVDLTPNRLTDRLHRLRASGVMVDDLTESNPTRVGIEYPSAIADALNHPGSTVYEPLPFGLPAARRAVAGDFERRGLEVARERIVLTASTSEAYSLLFKLLCDPGDEVLVPVPSYPLFDYLAALDSVVVRPYRLEHHGEWSCDTDGLASAVTPATRAVIVVNTNNPTGSYLKRPELEAITSICLKHQLALVGDEVFAEYRLDADPARICSVLAQQDVLTFALGGLSKSAGLPQLKLGWIAVGGPDQLVKPALDRLELICDTYLSVSTPVQLAAARLLDQGGLVRSRIRDRVSRNYARLHDLAAGFASERVLRSEGGWYAIVQVPATQSEESLVLQILEHDHVLVHPGYFFDFPREAFLVVSLLPAPEVFDRAVNRVLTRAASAV